MTTQKWNLVPVEITEQMHVAAVKVLIRANGIAFTPQRMFDAMLAAAPQPPKLSDERILELAARAEAQWNAVVDQYNQWGQLGFDEIVILISRAIEREILGSTQ